MTGEAEKLAALEAFTERVMHLYTRYLTSGPGVSVGQALVQAKRRYLGEASSGGFGTYDEKILIESTLYGLPMYEVSVPQPARHPPQPPVRRRSLHGRTAEAALGGTPP